MRRVKIVCTMGPAALAPGVLEQLIAAGMNCARLNFSHGAHEGHLATAERVREAARAQGVEVAILADLQGPKIRVGVFAGGPIELLAGTEFVLTGRDVECTRARASVSYPELAREVQPGNLILLDDGLIGLRVTRIDGDDVVCLVEVGGTLSDRKGVNLPGAKLSVPALTEKDRVDLKFAVEVVKADYLALSFVRRAADLREAQLLAHGTPVIAKMEKPEALENMEAILDEADGIMVARGDLGVEVGSERVPMAQKRMIREANRRGKVVITATQMLDSMIRNPRPTRAEAADVANAVLDGTDAIMLSGETATGRYPVETVRTMAAIAVEAEKTPGARPTLGELALLANGDFTSGVAHAAAELSSVLPLVGIVVVGATLEGVERLAAERPRAPIYALCPDEASAGRLAIRWGVATRVTPEVTDLDAARLAAARLFHAQGQPSGAAFALLTAIPFGSAPSALLLQTLA